MKRKRGTWVQLRVEDPTPFTNRDPRRCATPAKLAGTILSWRTIFNCSPNLEVGWQIAQLFQPHVPHEKSEDAGITPDIWIHVVLVVGRWRS